MYMFVRWEICEQNISTIFRVWEYWSVTESSRSNRMNYRWKWSLQKTFSSSTPLPPGFPESLSPQTTRISTIPSVGAGGGGGWIFSGTTHSINCNINTLWFSNNQQLLDKINTDTEMDDIIQDYNAVSYVVAVFSLFFLIFIITWPVLNF